MHLLVPRSRSSAKVKVKCKGYISPKNGCFGGIHVSQTHLFFQLTLGRSFLRHSGKRRKCFFRGKVIPFDPYLHCCLRDPFENIVEKEENAGLLKDIFHYSTPIKYIIL